MAKASLQAENSGVLEWAQLEPGLVVVATPSRAWIHEIVDLGGDPFEEPMRQAGSPESTCNLLDGAVAFAQSQRPDADPPELTLTRWVWRLAGYYHTTHATPGLMAEAAEKFEKSGRSHLAEYCRRKVEDERGHDELALRDLTDLRLPAKEVVKAFAPSTAVALVDHFSRLVHGSDDPIGCVGYAYALERCAVTIGAGYIDRVRSLLPEGVNALRCLKIHSAVSADALHVKDAVEVVARCDATERRNIAVACYETARIIYSEPPGGYPTDEELAGKISAFTGRSSIASHGG